MNSENVAVQFANEKIAMSKIRVRRAELDEAEAASIYAFYKAEREATINEYSLRRKLFERQLYYHPIVLATVILIVLAGIIFCAFQVWRDINSGESNTTTFKISREGMEISSSVVGLISLALSFLFFYLYVDSVYTLTELPVGNKSEITDTAPKK